MSWLLALLIVGVIVYLARKNVDRVTVQRIKGLGKVALLILGLILALAIVISLNAKH